MSYKAAFIAYTVISLSNLALIILEFEEKPKYISFLRLFTEVGLHFVVAYVYYSEWKEKNKKIKNE